MDIKTLQDKVRYLTNQNGEKTDVLIPLIVWKNILETLEKSDNNSVDLEEEKRRVIAEFKQSILDAREGKTFPVETLWENIDL